MGSTRRVLADPGLDGLDGQWRMHQCCRCYLRSEVTLAEQGELVQITLDRTCCFCCLPCCGSCGVPCCLGGTSTFRRDPRQAGSWLGTAHPCVWWEWGGHSLTRVNERKMVIHKSHNPCDRPGALFNLVLERS